MIIFAIIEFIVFFVIGWFIGRALADRYLNR